MSESAREKNEARLRALYRRGRHPSGPDLAHLVQPLISSKINIASFVGMSGEPYVDPQPGWLLPVLRQDADLDWVVFDGNLAPGPRGLQEPVGPRLGVDAIADCSVIFVPALLVDAHGFRLGRGGGSYDRALTRATGLTVALIYDDEFVEVLPREPHDQPVMAVATPSRGLVRFAGQ